MKKTLTTLALCSLMALSPMAMAKENSKYYTYDISTAHKWSKNLGLGAALSVALPFSWAASQRSGGIEDLAPLLVGIVGAGISGAGAIVAAIVATYSGFEDVDKDLVLKNYKKLKKYSRAAAHTGVISKDPLYADLLNIFSCSGCEGEVEKAKALASLISELDEVAQVVVEAEGFDKKNLEAEVESSVVKEAIKEHLGEDTSADNIQAALKIFSLALINAMEK